MKLVVLSGNCSSEMALIAASAHSHPMSESTIESCFGDLYTCIGIYQDDALCGFAILHQIFEDATLMDICVEPVHQGKGYGKALLDNVISLARRKDAEVLMLEVRESAAGAQALYLRAGFERLGNRKGYYRTEDGTEDAILMSLSL
ncbi:RibosOmAl-protein-alanine acetyltransferase [Shewanella piezotolerans WP3]|uniref:[Ribosomal protein bS18]-alanine N-acetyltransferase n=1 Tax=Shewanella piezotolerans (strain WP3 / JCM 13877) TaxID=225849 RepID=B8CSH8_SHEPW|nr:ribosomal protein S18-alanine N-acetyltransferase [Shewanella piezotolerans]ACJ30604.1 RibosOmAl-protein-alanine acetyltransferase [Shewanella piezotolerans WP3]